MPWGAVVSLSTAVEAGGRTIGPLFDGGAETDSTRLEGFRGAHEAAPKGVANKLRTPES